MAPRNDIIKNQRAFYFTNLAIIFSLISVGFKLISLISTKFTQVGIHLLFSFCRLNSVSPSEKMIVIGVTGTNGKTSTVNIISQYLDCLQKKNGLASTVNFKINDKKWLNKKILNY